MCYGCYEEYGSPTVINDNVKTLALMIADVYRSGGTVGCHVVLDDDNFEDDHIEYTLTQNHIKLSDEELVCMRMMEAMTVDERVTANAIYHGYITI